MPTLVLSAWEDEVYVAEGNTEQVLALGAENILHREPQILLWATQKDNI